MRQARIQSGSSLPLLLGLSVLTGVACDAPDPLVRGGSAAQDSAERAMAATDFASPIDSTYVLGRDMPPYPTGVESISAAVVHGRSAPTQVEWGFDHVRVGGRPALMLKRVVSRVREPMMSGDSVVGTRTTPHWRVEDVVVLPDYGAADRVVYSFSKPDGEMVVALGPYQRELRTVRPVRAAWGLDSAASRLTEIDPTGLRCGRS